MAARSTGYESGSRPTTPEAHDSSDGADCLICAENCAREPHTFSPGTWTSFGSPPRDHPPSAYAPFPYPRNVALAAGLLPLTDNLECPQVGVPLVP